MKDKSAKRMRLILGSLCFIVSACLVTTLVQGQNSDTDTTEPKRPFDSKGDVSIDFFRSMYETRFTRLDTDADGSLSKEEYLFLSRYPRTDKAGSRAGGGDTKEDSDLDGLPPQVRATLRSDEIEFEILDEDGDGRISKEEMMAPVALLASRDVNNDGKLDRKELIAMYKRKPGKGAELGRKK